MAIAANLTAALSLNSARYRQGLDRARQMTRRFSQNARRDLNGVRTAFAAVTAAVVALGGAQLIQTTARFQDLQTQLNSITGSAENGARAFNQIRQFATRSQFSVEQLTVAYSTLAAAGITPTNRLLRLFADTAAITSDQVGTLRAITDLFARSTAGGLGLEDLNRLADRGVPVFRILQERLGLTRLEITRFAQTAEGARTVLQALQEGIEEEFGGASTAILGNLSVAISNLRIAFTDLQVTVGNLFSEQLAAGINRLTASLSALAMNSDLVRRILNGLLGAFAILISTRLIRGLFTVVRAVRAIGVAAAITQAIIAFIPALIIGAGLVFGAFFTEITQLASAFFQTWRTRLSLWNANINVATAGASLSFRRFLVNVSRGFIDTFGNLQIRLRIFANQIRFVFANIGLGIVTAFTAIPNAFIRVINAVVRTINRSGIAAALNFQLSEIGMVEFFEDTRQGIRDGIAETNELIESLRDEDIVPSNVGEGLLDDALENYTTRIEEASAAQTAHAENSGLLSTAYENLTTSVMDTANGIQEFLFPTIEQVGEGVDDLGTSNIDTAATFDVLGGAAAGAGEMIMSSFQSTIANATDVTSRLSELGSRAFDGLSDALTDFVTTGMAGFGRLARSIIRDLIQIQIRAQLARVFSSATGGGGLFAGFFQNGGRIPSGQFGIVGEAGPELVRGPAEVTSAADTSDILNRNNGNITLNISAVDARSFESFVMQPRFAEAINNAVNANQRSRGIV